MRLKLVSLLGIGLWSCSTTNNKNSLGVTVDTAAPTSIEINSKITKPDTVSFDYESFFNLQSYFTEEKIEDKNFEIIDFDCAILIYPTNAQIDKMKKEFGEEEFYTIADDNNWYQGQAIELIDSVGIKKIMLKGQFLKLIGRQMNWDLDLRKKNLPSWNLIFFKTDKEPKIVSTMDMTVEEVHDYFNNLE